MRTLQILQDLVDNVQYQDWTFDLSEVEEEDGSKVLRLIITVPGLNSREPQSIRVAHFFPVPEATYNFKSWRRWLFDCCLKVLAHEAGEWFMVSGDRPFAPQHGPGADPYTIREVQTLEEAETDQAGVRQEGSTKLTRIHPQTS